MPVYDTIIIGGGQAGLSVAYFLRRTSLNYLILDDREEPGGSWQQTWDKLRLFSPTSYSSLSGWLMPSTNNEYPTKDQFMRYLSAYEKRYDFPVRRPAKVEKVTKEKEIFKIQTHAENLYARTVVSATGSAGNPFIPYYSGQTNFSGEQLHSINYRNADSFKHQKVLVIGGGNSGAQILAEVSQVAHTRWVTLEPPHFLPEEIDGRYLFHQANARYFKNESFQSSATLANIVQVKPVKEALNRGVYQDYRPFQAFYENGIVWKNGNKEKFDVVIWCTGFRADLKHLRPLNIFKNNRIPTRHTRSVKIPQLWLVGYGNWTGFASATIYGVGKTAKQTVQQINHYLEHSS